MIDIDKYETKKKRNWKLKATYPDRDNSVEAFNGYEDIVAVDYLGRERYTVAQMVDTGLEDAQLIADAPKLLAEIKRLREENEMLREELKNDDTGIKAIDGLLKAVGDRNEEVKRLREELDKAEQKRDKYDGALNIALEHLGYQDADHDEFCKEQYECNAYGDELLKCDIGCGGLLVNRYGDYVSTISLSESAGCEDEDCCNYYKGSEEE